MLGKYGKCQACTNSYTKYLSGHFFLKKEEKKQQQQTNFCLSEDKVFYGK